MPSFLDEALQAEAQRHKARLDSLKTAKAQLALLDALRPQFEAAGAWLFASQLQPARRDKQIGLYVSDTFTSSGTALLNAAAVLGFHIERDHDYGDWSNIWLSLGKLRLQLHAKNRDVDAAQAIAAGAVTDDFGDLKAVGPRRLCAMAALGYHVGNATALAASRASV